MTHKAKVSKLARDTGFIGITITYHHYERILFTIKTLRQYRLLNAFSLNARVVCCRNSFKQTFKNRIVDSDTILNELRWQVPPFRIRKKSIKKRGRLQR